MIQVQRFNKALKLAVILGDFSHSECTFHLI